MPEAKKSLSFGGANVNSVNNRSQLNVTFALSFGLLQALLGLTLSLLVLLALAPVALLSSHRFLIPNGLLQNASGAVAAGFTDQVLTSTPKS